MQSLPASKQPTPATVAPKTVTIGVRSSRFEWYASHSQDARPPAARQMSAAAQVLTQNVIRRLTTAHCRPRSSSGRRRFPARRDAFPQGTAKSREVTEGVLGRAPCVPRGGFTMTDGDTELPGAWPRSGFLGHVTTFAGLRRKTAGERKPGFAGRPVWKFDRRF